MDHFLEMYSLHFNSLLKFDIISTKLSISITFVLAIILGYMAEKIKQRVKPRPIWLFQADIDIDVLEIFRPITDILTY